MLSNLVSHRILSSRPTIPYLLHSFKLFISLLLLMVNERLEVTGQPILIGSVEGFFPLRNSCKRAIRLMSLNREFISRIALLSGLEQLPTGNG